MRRLLPMVAVVALIAPAPAAAEPCWQRLIGDWYDGRVDGVYSPACYRAAVARLPEDTQVRTSAAADLRQALTRSAATPALQRNSDGPSPIPVLIVIAVAGTFVLVSTARMVRARRPG